MASDPKALFEGPGFALIGMVHLPRLPETHGARPALRTIIERAVREARTLEAAGFEALLVENFGDTPFAPGPVPASTVAAMTLVVQRVQETVEVPVGVNVLRCDPQAALGIAAATDSDFVRLNVHTWPVMTDQGLLEGQAHRTVRLRDRLCPEVGLWVDVGVKHGRSMAPSLTQEATDNVTRGAADALLISGAATGRPARISDLESVVSLSLPVPVLLGSGVSRENLSEHLQLARGAVVGTAIKSGGITSAEVDPERARALVKARDELV